jgi:hypothetical protein
VQPTHTEIVTTRTRLRELMRETGPVTGAKAAMPSRSMTVRMTCSSVPSSPCSAPTAQDCGRLQYSSCPRSFVPLEQRQSRTRARIIQ